MRTIWFKQKYVEAIISGEKTDTVRALGKRKPPMPGDRVGLAVGPRPAFAQAIVESIEIVPAAKLDPARRREVAGMCGRADAYVRIRFRGIGAPFKRERLEQRLPELGQAR